MPSGMGAYNIETVLAEKVETILRRGVFNTRLRDFYDVYILTKTQDYDLAVFKKAFIATATHRGSTERIKTTEQILQIIRDNDELQKQWKTYQREYQYAKNITFMDTINALQKLL
jgi:predicted nucleotidyltransferase component of viral defense system